MYEIRVVKRFLGSVRRECLDHLFILGPKHLLRDLKGYVDYFIHHRPHQGLQQRIPDPLPASSITAWIGYLGGDR